MAGDDARSREHDQGESVEAELDQESYEHFADRAERAGRTLEAQIIYELQVNRGLHLPDPGDDEAGDRRRLFQRMFTQRPLKG